MDKIFFNTLCIILNKITSNRVITIEFSWTARSLNSQRYSKEKIIQIIPIKFILFGSLLVRIQMSFNNRFKNPAYSRISVSYWIVLTSLLQ